MANLYDKAGLVNIPVGYQEGFLYNIKPTDNTLAFRFNRDSAATRVNSKGLIEQVGYFGPELVTNGDFATDSDWSYGSSWSIANGKATATNSTTGSIYQDVLDTSKIYKAQIYQSISGLNTKNLKVTFDVTDFSGDAELRYPFRESITGNGSYTFYGVGTLDRVQFQVKSGFTASFSIDNVSVKQVDPNDYWTLGTGWSIGDGKAVAVNASNQSLTQSTSSVLLNKKYRISFDVEYISGSAKFQLVGAAAQDVATITSSGTQVIEVVSNENKTSYRVKGLTTGSGFNGSIDNVSVTEVLGDKPRIDYTDSLTSPSFLLEPQSTNLITYSQDFSQWTNTRSSDLSGFISPTGENNATKFISDNTASSSHIIKSNNFTISSGQKYTYSVFVKANQLNYVRLLFTDSSVSKFLSVYFNLTNGTVGTTSDGSTATLNSSNIENFGNGWFRCSVSGDLDTTTTAQARIYLAEEDNDAVFDGDGTSSIYIWGAQIEALSYPTSYIPTAGSTATRAQETCVGAGSASTFNSTEGVLYAEIAALANDGTIRRISLSDGGTSNRLEIFYGTIANRIDYNIYSNSSFQASGFSLLSSATGFNKIAAKYKQNDFALWVNGTEASTDTSGNTPIGLNKLQLQAASGSDDFYGKTKGVYVFNEALTDDELQQLTGPEYNSFAALAAAYNYTVI